MDTLTASHICISETQESTNARGFKIICFMDTLTTSHAPATFSGTANKHTFTSSPPIQVRHGAEAAEERRGWRCGAAPGRLTASLHRPKMRAETVPSCICCPSDCCTHVGLLLHWRCPAADGIGGREGRLVG